MGWKFRKSKSAWVRFLVYSGRLRFATSAVRPLVGSVDSWLHQMDEHNLGNIRTLWETDAANGKVVANN